ncbi:MAG: peptidoglycan-binding domain-containing protein [Candidatus Paceibacterota bacterium]
MKFNLKNVFLSVGIFAFTLALVGALSTNKAEAFARTASVTGNWADTATWGGNSVPTSSDTVTINAAVVVTINTAGAVASTVTLVDPVNAGNGITIASPGTLVVTGAITYAGSSGTGHTTVAVADGALTVANVVLTDIITAGGDSVLSVSTGSIITTGTGIAMTAVDTVDAQLLATSTGSITFQGTGTLSATGTPTVTLNAASTVNYSGAAQTAFATTYGHLSLSGTGAKVMTGVTTIAGNFSMSGTVTATPVITTIGGNVSITGTAQMTTGANDAVTGSLTVGTGAALHLGGFTLGIGTTSSITGTVDSVTVATGTKTFTGLVTINSGGVWDLSGFSPLTAFGAGITNNSATLMNNGAHASAVTLVGNIGGTGSITFGGPLTISSGTTTNNNTGTVTVTGTLTLTGAWTQAAGSSLTLLATTATAGAGVLTTTLANTVTYGGGTQTLNATAAGYYNLTLTGTGAKTWTANNDVSQTLTVNTGSTITLVDNLILANKLYFGTAYQKKGTWGAVAATATHETNTQFTTGVNQFMTVTLGKSTTVQQDGTTVTTCGSNYTLVSGVCTVTTSVVTPVVIPVVEPVVDSGCSSGNAYNSSTGAVCVNNATAEIPGCGNRNTGFSSASGVSCAQNKVVAQEQTQIQEQTKTTYNFGTSTLKNGSAGSAVVELQKFLNAKLNLGLALDGKLGPKTIAVIKKWQKANGLVSDGLVGPATKAKMYSME